MKNEKGLTLVEVLATFTILSVFVLLISSIHLFGVKQYHNQATEAQLQSNVRLAMKSITKDLRTYPNRVTIENEPEKQFIVNGSTYRIENNQLKKDNTILASHISAFTYHYINNKVQIEIQSVPSENGEQVSLSTTIYLRGEGG